MKAKHILLASAALLGIGAPIAATAIAQAPICVSATSEERPVAEGQPTAQTNPWDDFAKHYLSAEKVAMYMSWIAYIGTIIGLAANFVKLKKANNLTLKNVSDELKKKLEDIVSGQMDEQAKKFVPAIVATQEKTNAALTVFAKILALSQQNTPESRVAILQLIEELGTIGKDITESAKQAIELEQQAIAEHKEEIEQRLDEIIAEYDGTTI